jgi:putative membrane protein
MKVRIMVVGALAAALSGTLVHAADPSGAHFLQESMQGNLAEVKVGELAEQKGASQGVKDFGALLVKDLPRGTASFPANASLVSGNRDAQSLG